MLSTSTAMVVTQTSNDDTKMENEEELNETGGEEGAATAADGGVDNDDAYGAIVGTPKKSQFSLFLHETSVKLTKPLLVANLEFDKFDQAFDLFPKKIALLIRSNRESYPTELMIIHSVQRRHSLYLCRIHRC